MSKIMLLKKGFRYLTNSGYRMSVDTKRGKYVHLSDEEYIALRFKRSFKRKLNLNNPTTFNEKLQWLKLFDRRPEYTVMVDKHAVKQYVSEIIGNEHIIPTLGVWDKFDDIDFDTLPDQFVLKCTHDSGGLVICRDKTKFDKQKAKKKLTKSLENDFYLRCREWPYKNVPRKIIAEEYIEDTKTKELRDYKFFCFDGEPKALFVATDRQSKGKEVKFDFFDMNYDHLDVRNGHQNAKTLPERPRQFELMKELAQKLSAGIPFVRADFYEANGKVYFGELTFFHFSGFVPFSPQKWDYILGDWLKLPTVMKNE